MLFRSVTEQWLHSLTSLGQMEANQWQQCGNRTDFPIVTHLSCKKYVRVRVGTHSCVSVYEWWQLISEFLCKLHITCTSSSGHIWVSVCVCACVSVLACTVITSDLFSFFPLCVSASVHCDRGGVGQRQRHAQQWWGSFQTHTGVS